MSVQKSILFINRVYPPQRGATGRMLQDLARHLARNGWHVSVLCTGDKNETTDDKGVQVIRIKAEQKPRRMFSYLYILMRLYFTALKEPARDIVVSMTDPPLLPLCGHWIARRKKSKHIHWAQDIYPDLLTPMGSSYPNAILNFAARRVRRTMNRSQQIVAIGRCMARHLSYTGCDTSKVKVIPNWANLSLYDETLSTIKVAQHTHGASKPFAEQIKTGQKFKILYAGNIGLLHPMEPILKAAEILKNDSPDIEFVFAGDGAGFDALAKERAKRGLSNIRFMPYQPEERLRFMMESGDVHLVSMAEDANGLMVPSKTYSAFAVGRPCIFIGPHLCEAARIIRNTKAGSIIKPDNVNALVKAIKEYRYDADKWYAAHHGAQDAAKECMPDTSLKEWLDLLDGSIS